jgi:hypothetical protein
MNKCSICDGSTNKVGKNLCNHCRDLKFKAERFIRANPERARIFFRDLVIEAGQTLRTGTKTGVI